VDVPASVIQINGRRQGEYVLLETALPARAACAIGVILLDLESGRPWFRMRREFDSLADPEDAEVLEGLAEHIQQCLTESGADNFLRTLEDSLSNALRITERRAVSVDAFSRALDRLYREHVEETGIARYDTHLPLISLRAAAGGLGEEMQSSVEDWIPGPPNLRLSPDLFVAHVEGRSMEPRIPDGSLNLFRLHPAGSRQGKILLIERFGVLDDTARYTVKRYTSRKAYSSEDEWQHEQIRLEPLNPEFEPWDVDPEGFAVVAEWLRTID
jgi:SOS-response transcriptional repressor LexA